MAESAHDLIFPTPVFHGKIWGGRKLADDFGYQIPETVPSASAGRSAPTPTVTASSRRVPGRASASRSCGTPTASSLAASRATASRCW